jgi:flagellar M-ring protein FliF
MLGKLGAWRVGDTDGTERVLFDSLRCRVRHRSSAILMGDDMLDRQALLRIANTLRTLGWKKHVLFGTVVTSIVGVVLLAAWILAKQDMDVAYIGLSPHDAPRLTRVLREAGFAVEFSSDSTRLSTKKGDISQVRAFLAERGLPASHGVGYELFDKVGPLGLTSFMQEITRIRALEGEIGRTIQALRGVHSARVHIAVADAGNGKRGRSASSASVVVRADNAAGQVQAIRNIVSAAVPGLNASDVRVVGTDGDVLAAGADETTAGADRVLALEKALVRDIQAKVARTLTPMFGRDSFETTASIKLHLDKRQTQETSFDPAGRVERSVRTLRESGSQTSTSSRNTVSVDRNIPGESGNSSAGDPSRRANQKRDEVTNYEIGSRSIASVVDGYRIERLSVAVVLDTPRISGGSGIPAPQSISPDRLAEIERLIVASVGADATRGDIISVSTTDFKRPDAVAAPVASWSSWLEGRTTLLTQSAILLLVVASLIVFGLRPAIRALGQPDPPETTRLHDIAAARPDAIGSVSLSQSTTTSSPDNRLARDDANSDETSTATIRRLIESDPNRAAVVLKRWIRQDA